MTVGEFLAQLPKPFSDTLSAMSIGRIVDMLPEALYKELMEAVKTRFRRDIPKFPTLEESQLWRNGDRMAAMRAFKDRTGCSVLEAKTALDGSTLDTFTREVFLG